MAATIPLPDTSAAVEKKAIGNIRGVSPIKPLTSKVAVPKPKQPSPGLSTKPVTTGATPQGAKLKQPPRSTGRVNSGNSTADSIITALGKIGLAYADTYPSVMTEGSIAKLTRSELLNYVLANHANKSYTKQPLDLGNSVEVDMNDAEVTALVTAWCTERSIS